MALPSVTGPFRDCYGFFHVLARFVLPVAYVAQNDSVSGIDIR